MLVLLDMLFNKSNSANISNIKERQPAKIHGGLPFVCYGQNRKTVANNQNYFQNL